MDRDDICPVCKGSGIPSGESCESCSGTHFKEARQAIDVSVFFNEFRSKIVILEGYGNQSLDGTYGNVYVELLIKPNDQVWLEEDHFCVYCKVSPVQKIIGDTGYVDMFGRRRWVPEVYSVNNKIREGGLREAVNAPIQSLAAGIVKEAMRRLCPKIMEWKHSGGVVMPLLQVHDELIFEVGEDYVDAVVWEFVPIMEHAVELIVPVGVGVKVGKRWGSMKEIKD
jgi:hypothetical protein